MSGLFITSLWQDPYLFFCAAFLVIFSICCHEFMHAWAALKEGDPTAADRGHLTLNPLKQMGWFSLVLFALLGFAWGQVPVNPSNFRNRFSRVKVALAGPLTNLFLSFVLVLICALLLWNDVENTRALEMIFYGSVLNLVLFILNMIPVPGFDGYNVAEHFFPGFLRLKSEVSTILTVVLILLLFSSVRYLFAFAYFLNGKILQLLMKVLQ